MVYVYRRASSVGARELAEALGGKRWRGRVRPIQEVVRPGDAVICWGEHLDPIRGVKILNGGVIQNKMQDALKLKAAGVATIDTALQKPAPQVVDEQAVKDVWGEAVEAAEDFIEIPYARNNPVFLQGVREFSVLVAKLHERLAQPPALAQTWLPRLFNHIGGADLLQPPAAPDYWVKKEPIQAEVRVHSFNGKSIRAGQKKPRAGERPHEWIRSYEAGWSIIYDGFESTKVQRELAHAAVKALGLEFGAVDLAQRADGSWFVLEVNRAPGLDGNTIPTYAGAVQKWLEANRA